MSSATTSPAKPPSRATSPGTQAQQTINAALGRLSFESEKSSGLGSPPPPAYTDSTPHPLLNGNGLVNGDAHGHGDASAVDGGEGGEGEGEGEVEGEEVLVVDPIEKLQQELERTRQEREEFASQYRNLLARLNTMRSTLGNKLKQDAVRLISMTSLHPYLLLCSRCFTIPNSCAKILNLFISFDTMFCYGVVWFIGGISLVSCRKNSTEENKPFNP